MKPTMNWKLDVVTEAYYNALVGSGYAWEMYPDLPESWAKCLEILSEERVSFNEEKPHRRNESVEYMRIYREENKEAINSNARGWKAANKEKMRESKLKERYGITIEDYNEILASQNMGCAICNSLTPKRKGSEYLVVDHCHDSGEVRGLLCYKCNVGLGSFEDDLILLIKAAEYLGKNLNAN